MIKQKATISPKMAINTITWVWKKSLILHTVTFRGIVNVKKIYCDFFSYLSCDFLSCDLFFRLPIYIHVLDITQHITQTKYVFV